MNSNKNKPDSDQTSLWSRKKFLATGGLFAGYLLSRPFTSAITNTKLGKNGIPSQQQKPNVIFIVTDQMSATMLSCTGNNYVHTPNLDRLANSGVRFERAYSANPVCVPSRYSIFSGDLPSQIGLLHNSQLSLLSVPQQKLDLAMGNVFKKAGYQTVYGGKTHLVGKDKKYNNVELYGFENLTPDFYDELVNKSSAFIKQKHDKPFLLVVSLVNPHDICYMAIEDYDKAKNIKKLGGEYNLDSSAVNHLAWALQKPEGVSEEEFFAKYCPPLPTNFEIPDKELTAFMADKPNFMHWVRENWTEKDWRLHRWAYARLTEMVDKQIGEILDTLKEAGLEENTIVIYTSDHGEQDGSHRVDEKAFLYEESVRVPFLVSWKRKIKPAQVDNTHLVSNGLDIIPSMCDLAGITVPEEYKGKSVKPIVLEQNNPKWRHNLVVENNIARLVIMDRFKYMVGKDVSNAEYLADDTIKKDPKAAVIREMLIDLKSDPGEMKNLAYDKNYHKELLEGRRSLLKWYKKNKFTLEEGYKVK